MNYPLSKTAAANTPNNDAPSLLLAMMKLCEKQVVVAQARTSLLGSVVVRACVVGRHVIRNFL
jgi:hypothetical protein